MTSQNNLNKSKPKLQDWIIILLIIAVIAVIGSSISDLVNVQIFEDKKLYYCPGDKYFASFDKSIMCIKFINMIRQPFFYAFILFLVIPFFLWEHYYENRNQNYD